MNKKEIQKRVLQHGKPLDLSKFNWDEKTKTFSSSKNGLVLDFKGVNGVVFNTENNCTFNTGSNCTFNTGPNCTFDTGLSCTFDTGSSCTFKTGSSCTFRAGSNCTFKTGDNCKFNTGPSCTFNTSWHCTFDTGPNCTFDTGASCIFDTESHCTFKTIWNCTFKTSSDCTFDIREEGYFINKTSNNIVVVRCYDKYKLYELNKLPKAFLQLGIDKVLEVDKVIEKPIKKYELIDKAIMIKLSSEKIVDGVSVYKTQYISDYFNNIKEKAYVAKDNEYTAHGTDIKDAIKNVIFKKQYTLGVEVNAKRVVESNIVTMEDYRLLTGSCEEGTKRYLDEHNIAYDTVMSIEDTIKLIESTSAYRKEIFIENLKKAGWEDRV